MSFYFFGRLYILMVMKRKLNRIYGAISCFRGSRDRYGYDNWKIILKNSLVISPWHLNRSVIMPKWGWLKKLIGGETTLVSVDVYLFCKTYFVLDMLCTFLQYRNPRLNKEPEPERQSIADFFTKCRETIDGSEPPGLIETEVVEEPEPIVTEDPEQEL